MGKHPTTGERSTLLRMSTRISSPEVSELSDLEESIITLAFLGRLSALILHAHRVLQRFNWRVRLFGQAIATQLLLAVCLA
jgi:hypothetical protein